MRAGVLASLAALESVVVGRSTVRGLLVAILASLALPSFATRVEYSLDNLGGGSWRYNYTVLAEVGDPAVEEFTIYFDALVTSDLMVFASPASWDSIVVQPEPILPADGYFDSLAVSGLSPLQSAGGFSVNFTYLGIGTPGSQRFDVIDPSTFETLVSGFTQVAGDVDPPVDVPEPHSGALIALGLACVAIAKRRRQS